jgi:hypothetical protein
MELVLLIERLHCVYVEAFLMRDCQTKWWWLGKPQQNYVEKIEKDPLMPYIHWQCFSEYQSLRLSKIDNLISRQNVSFDFIQSAQYPASGSPYYLDQDGANQLVTALVKNNHYQFLSHCYILFDHLSSLDKLTANQLEKLCQMFVEKQQLALKNAPVIETHRDFEFTVEYCQSISGKTSTS